MKTAKDIINLIDETVEYYKTHPRSYNNETCQYTSKINGIKTHCAVGRCMTEEMQGVVLDSGLNDASLPMLLANLDEPELFKDEYRGFSQAVWGKLQDLHDTGAYWHQSLYVENKLTPEGQIRVDKLKEWVTKTY